MGDENEGRTRVDVDRSGGTAGGALDRARRGDDQAFRALTEQFRAELQVHCYRMVGSVQDAEDLLQETLLAAWRSLDSFQERSSVRTWLYRIATNRCLNALRDSGRRPQRVTAVHHPPLPEPTRRVEASWLEPYPDQLLDQLPAGEPGPEARYERRESVALAFLAGLQTLPARQRAALVLRDVLGFSAVTTAEMLDTTTASVNSALQRARVTLQGRARPGPARLPADGPDRAVLDRFVAAFEAGDTAGLIALLTDDSILTMPPEPLEYQGARAIGAFFELRSWWGPGAVRLVPTAANLQPAFGYYLRDTRTGLARAHGLVVLGIDDGHISSLTRFGDNGLLPRFGLPVSLRD